MIEVMVVLVIMAAIVTMVIPKISNRNNQMKAAVRHISVLTREARNHAQLFGSTHRIVINMDQGIKSPKHSYWVEKSSKQALLPSDRKSILELENKPKDRLSDDEKAQLEPFEPADRLMRNPRELPSDLKFRSVELAGLDQTITQGRAYIYFFPSGLVEESIIQLSSGDQLQWSVLVHPLTGKSDIVTRQVSLKEIQGL